MKRSESKLAMLAAQEAEMQVRTEVTEKRLALAEEALEKAKQAHADNVAALDLLSGEVIQAQRQEVARRLAEK